MPDQDRVTAAAERRRAWDQWCMSDDLQTQSLYAGRDNNCISDLLLLADAYLAAPPPLTRERLEKAVGELMDGIRGATGGHEPFDRVWLTDRLCRLLGVEE